MRLFGRRKRERELQAEIEAHLAIDIQERIDRGESPEAARASALRQFGNVALVQEVTRGVWSTRLLDRVEQDGRHALRYTWGTFKREPGFVLLTILTLALVMGSNTLLFSAFNTLILKNRPGAGNPDRLVDFVNILPRGAEQSEFSYPNYLDYRNDTSAVDLAAYSQYEKVGMRTTQGLTQSARVAAVSGNYFDVLEVRAAAGRLLRDADDRADTDAVVVISHRVWIRVFGGVDAAIGSPLVLRGRPFTIVGVAPPEFVGTDVDHDDAWIPFAMYPGAASILKSRDYEWIRAVGRMKPGLSLKQAQASAEVAAAHLGKYPENKGRSVRLVNGWYHGFQGETLKNLLGLCVVILMMACANVAAIGLSRALARHSEIVVRLALGAHRRRIVFQLLTETTALFAPAAVLGFFAARGFTTWERLAEYRAIEADLSPDWRVAVFTLGLTLVAALVAGLTPALQAARTDLSSVLKEKSGGTANSRLYLQSVLIVGQVAVSVALLTVGGLYWNTLRQTAASRSFDPSEIYVVSLDFDMAGLQSNEDRLFVHQVLARLRALPGITSAAVTSDIPHNDEPNWGGMLLWKSGKTLIATKADLWARTQSVTPAYFGALGVPLVAGRDFNSFDASKSSRVAILSKGVASSLWPGENPLGKLFYSCADARKCETEVVGIAAETIRDKQDHLVYVPYDQMPSAKVYAVFKSAAPASLIPAIRAMVSEMNANLPIISIHSMQEVMHSTFFYQYLMVWSAGLMGGIAIVMASLGIYGVSSHSVAGRMKEIGIRMALGAQPVVVIGSLIRRGITLAVIGLPLGCAAGFLAARQIPELGEYNIIPFEPSAYVAACVGAMAVAFIATYLPARRAAKADPMTALRHE